MALSRLQVIQNHLSSKFPEGSPNAGLEEFRKSCPFFNQKVFSEHYFSDLYPYVIRNRQLIDNSPLFDHQETLSYSIEEYRGKVIEQIKYLYSDIRLNYEIDKTRPLLKMQAVYTMAEFDLSVSTRLIVHLILYIDTLQNLGTSKHADIINRAYLLKDYGCFGMTELGHGSNVASIETTATYEAKTGGFILNSPTPTSAKWWIGAAANTANMSAIFAQLIVDGVNKGVHVFAVPIRDYQTHDTFPGVTIGDCGKKSSLDGIDNGFILFKNYRIGYNCLLDKFSQIRDGKFKSAIKNKEKRLGVMMGGLIRGRYAVVNGSEINARLCLTIALRYAAVRKQFGPSNELPIIDYQLHRYRLIPLLSQVLAMRSAADDIFNIYSKVRPKADLEPECDELNELHSLLSSVKAVASWMSRDIAQVCREACGGLGFSSYSSISRYRSYQDIHTTWEGDNSVLIQQTGKYILKILQKSFKGQKIAPPTLSFLKFDIKEVRNFKSKFTTREELENDERLIELLEYRVNHLMHECVLRLQENSTNAKDMSEAWNNTQVFYIQELSKAYGELAMTKSLKRFYQEVSSDCKETGNVVKKFFYLFVFDRILNCASFYLESAINKPQEKIIKDCILKLCDELAPFAVCVVDALAPSDKILASAIGAADGQAYANMIKVVEADPKVYSKPNWLYLIKDIRNSKSE